MSNIPQEQNKEPILPQEPQAQAPMPQPPEPPQDAGQVAPNQELLNPFDTSNQENELSALEEELAQSTSAIDNDFATFYAENMPEDVEDLFFEDRVQFLLAIENAKQDFIQEKITPLQQKRDGLAQEIEKNKTGAMIWEAQTNFRQKYPEADLDELLQFYNENLSPKQKQQLEDMGDLAKAYEKVYLIMTGQDSQDSKQNKPKKDLPKQTTGQFGNIEGLDLDLRDSDLPINRR